MPNLRRVNDNKAKIADNERPSISNQVGNQVLINKQNVKKMDAISWKMGISFFCFMAALF